MIKPWNNRTGSLKINKSLNLSSWVRNSERAGISGSSMIMAVSKEVSGENDKNSESDDGNGLVFEDILDVAQVIHNLLVLCLHFLF